MSEWPKKLYAEAEGARWKMLAEREGPYPRSRRYPFEVEVVPADLARELYEAAKDAPARIKADPQYGACYGPLDLGKGVKTVERLEAACARYEREVGE